jgi:hypothetical protein
LAKLLKNQNLKNEWFFSKINTFIYGQWSNNRCH